MPIPSLPPVFLWAILIFFYSLVSWSSPISRWCQPVQSFFGQQAVPVSGTSLECHGERYFDHQCLRDYSKFLKHIHICGQVIKTCKAKGICLLEFLLQRVIYAIMECQTNTRNFRSLSDWFSSKGSLSRFLPCPDPSPSYKQCSICSKLNSRSLSLPWP